MVNKTLKNGKKIDKAYKEAAERLRKVYIKTFREEIEASKKQSKFGIASVYASVVGITFLGLNFSVSEKGINIDNSMLVKFIIIAAFISAVIGLRQKDSKKQSAFIGLVASIAAYALITII